MATKAMDEVKELKNLVDELKANMVKKDTRLDIFKKGMMSCAPFLEKPKKMLLRSSKLLVSLPSF